MLSVTPTPVELIDDDTATKYYNEIDSLTGPDRDSRADALRLWAEQKKSDQKREQFDTLNKIYSDFDGYVNEAGLQDFDEDSRYNIANRQFIASQFDQTPEEQQNIYSSFRDKWTESVNGKKGMSEKETFDLIKQGIDARNEVSEAANQIPGDIALSLFDSIGGNDPVDVPKLIETWKAKNADSIKKLPPGWEAPLLESAQAFHKETEGMLRDYAEPLKKVYDHLAAVTGRDTERAGETNPKNQEEMDSMLDTLASMPKPVRERAYASVVLGAQKAGQDPKKFMEQWGESWSRTLNMVRTGALTAQEMSAESDLRMLEDKASPPDYYISKSTGEKIPFANRAFHDEADLRKVTPKEIAAEADKARQKVKRFEVVRELQSVADNQFDPIEKINKGGFLGFMESMAYGTPESLAYTATALVPVVGPYVAGAAMFSDEYNQLRQQGMSVDQAVQVGSVSAAIQAGLERTGAEMIFGKLPVFEKLMRKIANPARVRKAGSAGIRFFSSVLGENLVEGAQDLTTPLVQDVSEALGADVPNVKWQPILNQWAGSRLDVLAATIPTILLGTGVATMADNKRFAQFEERQDLYRMTGMDDSTIKKIEDGKDLAEVQQNFQSEFGKLTPENVKAGIAYMEGKIASAKDQQEDPNTHTLTRETLADGSKKFVIRDPKGDVRYTTGDAQTAQIALSELLRTQITGTTRGIFESISFFNQLNEAAGRGEDVQKFLLSNSPRNLLTDYEANPTEQNLNTLFETVRSQGQDINEPAELANFPVLASNQGALVEGVFRSIIQIQDGATGDKVVRDFSQDNLKRAISEGRITMDWVRENLNQIIPLIESERNTGPALRTETDTDVIESFSDVALAYMTGRIREEQIPEGFRGFLRRMAIIVKDIFRRSYNLKRAIAEGKVDANFESFLADSVGLNQQARVDTARERVSNEVLTDTNFSIGKISYPMEDNGKWYSNEDFAQRGGRIVTMSPDEYLSQVRPLEVDEASRDNIDDLKNMMQSGRKLDPLAIYADGKEDGRHRATAAKELGMDTVPVLDFRANKPEPKGNDFSIGSRASAVSTDTPSIRASNATITGPANYSIGAFHGTPHKVDKFSTEKIGTGEGAQAYGWGLYFAQNHAVAEDYQNKLTADLLSTADGVFDISKLEHLNIRAAARRSLDEAMIVAEKISENGSPMSGHAKRDLEKLKQAKGATVFKGNLYTVDLDVEPEDMLDWDKPLSKQSPKVQTALAEMNPDYRPDSDEYDANELGQMTYSRIPRGVSGNAKVASEKLLSVGIKGIRYLDGDSRNSQGWKITPPSETVSGKWLVKSSDYNSKGLHFDTEAEAKTVLAEKIAGQTYNYVAFDENLIKITEENGNRIPASQALAQPVSTDTNYSIGKVDETTGLPLNPNGTVTVYHGTTKESAEEIQRTGILKSAGEPDVYFTTAKEGTGYGDGTVVGVEIDPKKLILDYEFPDGRRDFRVNVGTSKRLAVNLSTGATNYSIGMDLREIPLGADLAQVWNKFPKSEVSLPDLPENATPDELRKIAEQALRNQPDRVTSAFEKEVVLHDVKNIKGKAEHFVSGQYRERRPEPNRVRTLQMLAHTIRNAMAYGSAGKNRFAYIYRYNDGTVHVVIVQNAAGKQAIQRQFTITQFDHDTSKQISGIRILRKKESGPQPTATPQPLPSSAIGASEKPATPTQINQSPKDVNKNYSIASQSEIDRVNKALGGMNRGPDERLKVYQRAKQSFSRVMQENKEELDAIRSSVSTNTAPAIEQIEMDRAGRIADIEAEENTEVAKALEDNADTFLPRIEAAPTPAERKRVERDAKDRAKILEQGIRDKYAERKKSTDAEAKSQRDQTLQAAAAKDSAANARVRDKVRQTKLVNAIGELDGILKALPPEVRGRVGGFAVLANIGTGDKALADFFVKRIDMIDRQLERTLKEEYGNVFDALLERTKPKKAAAGEKPKGIGADIQSLFATVREARDWSAEKVDGHIANLETQIASGNLTAQEEAILTREADLVSLVGDWKNADSSRRAAALSAATETWAKGMSAFVQKKIREREDRDMARAEAISATGKKGDYVGRRKRSAADNGLRGKVHGWFMDTLAWDGVVNMLFGHESPMAIRLSDGQRKAEYAKIDAVAAKEESIHDLFTKLANGNRAAGEKLMWQMSQPSISANGLNLSELEALSATMLWMQEDGRRHMEGELNENGMPVSKWHYDQKFIDEIESALSPEAKAVRDYLLDAYAKEWFAINSVYRELNGVNLPQIKNYSPVTVRPMNAPSGMVTDPVTGHAISATSISPGALRTRGTAIAEPAFRNVVQTYLAHTRQMEHWKAFAPWIKEANGILRFRDVQDSIHEAGGEEAIRVLNKFLDAFAQGGNRDASLGLKISEVLNSMASRAAQVALIGRVGTLAIQTTQIGAASAELPMGAYVYRLGKLLTGNLGWGDSLNSAYIQRRLKQMPPIVQIAMEGLKAGRPNQLKHQVEKIGRLISGTDALWTAGTYAMVYDYHLGQAKTLGYTGKAAEDYAHNTAERVTDRLAQPTRMGAKSIYEITMTHPGARLGWAFASETRKNIALLAYTKANRPLKQFGAATLGFIVFNMAMGAFIRNAWKDMKDDGDDEDEFFDAKTWNLKRIGIATLTEPLQGIPFLGDYTEKGINAALGQYHQSSDLISFERGVRAIKHIPDIVHGEREMGDVLKDIDGMVSLMGYFDQNAAAASSLTHLASDFFGVAENAASKK